MISSPCEKISQSIRSAVEIILKSRRGVVLSGAGISTASGIPDFRSPNTGLWRSHEPLEVASLTTFRYDPIAFYSWLHPLASKILSAEPNPAHFAITRLQQRKHILTVITQNIDGLHQKAGNTNVLEVHGSFTTMTCLKCFQKVSAEPYIQPYIRNGTVPLCPQCNEVLKPDLILFGEQMPYRPWLTSQKVSRQCDLMIVAGSSLEVLPVASLPMQAIENGAHLIIINHSPTYLDVRADVVFHDDVTEILPLLADEVVKRESSS
jgi:NAD-dependent deacetylase